MDVVERIVAIDWSGRVDAAGQRRHIFSAVWERGVAGKGARVRLENGRTREEIAEWLIELARETKRMVVGIDFCFSYPSWFLEEHGVGTAPEFWDLVVREHGESWLGKECRDARFWGRVGKNRNGKKPTEFCGELGHRMLRRADVACKVQGKILNPEQAAKVKGIAPKSPFQIGGAGAVGTGTLRGIPVLQKLHQAGFSVWPFEEPSFPLVVEIYPRLLTGEVKKSNAEGRKAYLARAVSVQVSYAQLDESVLEKARGSEDAFDALVSVMVMAQRRESFAKLKRATDSVTLLEGAVWGAGE